jgi:uncharacterized membrane protein
MRDFILSSPVQAVIWVAAAVALSVLGWLIVGIFRGRDDDDQPMASKLLTNFREMHHEGDINDSEFRTIKTVLGARLHEELNEEEDTG